jgi:alpha-1,2-mannosyltransferase
VDLRARAPRPAVVLAALAAAASIAAHLVVARTNPHLWDMLDLDVYRWGGSTALHRGDLYGGIHRGLSFTYPPFAAAAFVPFAVISLDAARWALTATSVACLFAAVHLTQRAIPNRQTRARAATRAGFATTLVVGAVALWFEPVQQTLGYGQINLVLLAVLLADLLRPDDRRTKGIGVGIAVGLKLTPAIFVVHLLVTRRRRAAITAAASAVATVLATFVVLPNASWDFWFGHRFVDTGRVGEAGFVANQALNGVIVRAMGSGPAATMVWILAVLAVAPAGLRTAAALHRRGNELGGVLLCALVGLLVSPISWSHHWVWIVPAWVYAVDVAWRHRSRVAIAAALLVPLAVAAWPARDEQTRDVQPKGLIWSAPETDGVRWAPWQSTLGALYVIAGTATLVVASRASSLLDESQAARRHRRVDGRQLDPELGEVAREDVLGNEHRLAVDGARDALAHEHR